MRVTACTDPGHRRKDNQDTYRAVCLDNRFFWAILCDGMGGMELGKEASHFVASFLFSEICEKSGKLKAGDAEDFLVQTIEKCNAALYEKSTEGRDRAKMGTTLVAAVIHIKDGSTILAHSGDSRAYLLTHDKLDQLTVDHSMVQEMVDSGKLTPEQARRHPNRNIITSAIGVEPSPRIDIARLKIKKGERLLLCSDGLSNTLSDSTLKELSSSQDFYSAAERLIHKAVSLGADDNITALLFEA